MASAASSALRSAASLETSIASSLARTAMAVGTEPKSTALSTITCMPAASSAICALVRITTSHGSPARNLSSIAPTAPKLPAISTPAFFATAVTSPCAAPALTNSSRIALLIGLRARDLHDARPLLDVLAHEARELLGRHRHRGRPLLRPGLAHLGRIHRARDLGVQLLDDGARRSRGRHDAEPDDGLVSAHARFVERRDFRQHRRAHLARRGERFQLARAHVGRHRRDRVEHHLHLAAEY